MIDDNFKPCLEKNRAFVELVVLEETNIKRENTRYKHAGNKPADIPMHGVTYTQIGSRQI
jgi:hypothetical protein